MRIQRKFRVITMVVIGLTAVACSSLAVAATVQLTPGESTYDPSATDGGTTYDTTIPAVVSPANLVTTLSSTYNGVGGEGQTQAGTFTSQIYKDPLSGYLTFVYSDTSSGSSTDNMESINLADLWPQTGLAISDNGAASSTGSSSPILSSANTWTNGEPTFIQWKTSNNMDIEMQNSNSHGTEGTLISPGNYTAQIFFATNATNYATDNAAISDGASANASYLGPAPATVPGPPPSPSSASLSSNC